MAIRRKRRRALGKQGRQRSRESAFFEQRCRAIYRNQLIPIIGDTIRIAHIFDVNDDQDIGVAGILDKEGYEFDGDEQFDNVTDQDEGDEKDPCADINYEGNVIEELAQYWAYEVNYPLADTYHIARVAQFHELIEESDEVAKVNFLSFLKSKLLSVAQEAAELEGDVEELAFVRQLEYEHTLSFADIVTELDYPQFPEGKEDPLRILARLPLKIYLTTSYYNFIERELEAAGKHPKSRLCFWNGRPSNLIKEHEPNPNYKPTVNQPVVYHLFGMEQYPQSLVLSEDDYLDFLWMLARDIPGDSGERIIPPYLQAELNKSSLLLLGYRLGDWDLRMLFRGLLNPGDGIGQRRLPSTAIQIDLKDQPLVEDEEQAEVYLKKYFRQARLDVRFGDSDEFVTDLWREWQRWSQGANKS